MSTLTLVAVLLLVVGVPVGIAADRAAVRNGVGGWRRRAFVALTVLALPLGIGAWLAMVRRPPARRRG
jgi:hypothetical protein